MIPRGSGFAVESGARPSARVRLAAAGVLAAGLLSAHAALSRPPAAEGAAAASGLRARALDGVESNTARQRAYYLLARKDCMALSDKTRNACLAEARMLWGQQAKR
jgi:hypothetical protein